LKIYNSIQCVK